MSQRSENKVVLEDVGTIAIIDKFTFRSRYCNGSKAEEARISLLSLNSFELRTTASGGSISSQPPFSLIRYI